MYTTVISSQGQTSVPTEVRKLLGVEPGAELVWQVESDNLSKVKVVVTTANKESILSLRGVADKAYEEYGGGDSYLKKERKSWEK